jgi:MraZ protein
VEESGGKWIFFHYFSRLIEKNQVATFIGDYTCKVDSKGRIILPMAFKKQMPADAQDHFVVKKDMHEKCLILYAKDDWERHLEKIRRLNRFNREHSKFLRNYFMGTAELTLDNNNRILVPKRLMDLIEADRDVVLAGQDGVIEIWPANIYNSSAMSPEELSELSEKLLGNINEP